MNVHALLALIGDLYAQLTEAKAAIEQRDATIRELSARHGDDVGVAP